MSLLRHIPLLITSLTLFSSLLFVAFPFSLQNPKLSAMAEPLSNSAHIQRATPTRTTTTSAAFLRRLQEHAPINNTQLVGLLTLLITGAILLLLAGITVTAIVLCLIFFTPLIIISSPIWVPAGTLFLFVAAGFLCLCGFGVGLAAGMSWMYRYFKGLNPPGSGRIDYARSRIYDTANHVKDYAREYGGYLQSKVKDAAPGA